MNETFWSNCKPRLVPEIPDEKLESMLAQIKPVERFEVCGGGYRYRLIDIAGVDRRRTAYTWKPKLGRLVRIYDGSLNSVDIITFHTWGYYGFFKPSLAETMACIAHYLPDWSGVRFVWLDKNQVDSASVVGDFHICRCRLFGDEQTNVIDDALDRDSAFIAAM